MHLPEYETTLVCNRQFSSKCVSRACLSLCPMIWQLFVFQTMIWEQILALYLYKYCDPHWYHNCHRIEPMRYVVITARNPPNIQTWCQSQWPCGLRCRSTVARLLRLWVRIPTRAWMSVCRECCVLSGRGLCNARITHPEESYWMWCVVCGLETSRMRWPWPALGHSAKGGEKIQTWYDG